MITPYTTRELHYLAGRLEAARRRVQEEAGESSVPHTELVQARDHLLTASREADALAKEQHHKR